MHVGVTHLAEVGAARQFKKSSKETFQSIQVNHQTYIRSPWPIVVVPMRLQEEPLHPSSFLHKNRHRHSDQLANVHLLSLVKSSYKLVLYLLPLDQHTWNSTPLPMLQERPW